METLFAIIFGYLLGSIPFGLLIIKFAGKGDIRNVGSGNIGASNATRAGGKWLGLLTFLCDASKGALAYFLIFWWLGGSMHAHLTAYMAGFFAVIGHNFPIWLKFKGGKGVATSFGLYLAALPLMGILAIVVWFIAALWKNMASFASLVSLLSAPIFALIFNAPSIAAFAFLLWILAMVRHKDNLVRIKAGSEATIWKR